MTGWCSPWIPAALGALQYGLGVVRAWLRQDVARICFPTLLGALRGVRRFDVWAGPLVSLALWFGLASAAWGRQMSWRGIRYELLRGGRARRVDLPAVVALGTAPSETPLETQTEPLRKAG